MRPGKLLFDLRRGLEPVDPGQSLRAGELILGQQFLVEQPLGCGQGLCAGGRLGQGLGQLVAEFAGVRLGSATPEREPPPDSAAVGLVGEGLSQQAEQIFSRRLPRTFLIRLQIGQGAVIVGRLGFVLVVGGQIVESPLPFGPLDRRAILLGVRRRGQQDQQAGQ